MTARDYGFLLLTSPLGDPERKPLTVAQFRELTRRARQMEKPLHDRELTQKDLVSIGCSSPLAQRILRLLCETEQLEWYLAKGKERNCTAITRLNGVYPGKLRTCLGLEAPATLWAKGNLSLFETPMIALVGSRDLRHDNYAFATAVGKQAAIQGYTLVSGNARGADKTAQDACLDSGGTVISVVADGLESHVRSSENILYLSEDGFDLPFSSARALSRNRVIHALGEKTFVAQCTSGRGGTWDGTVKNLQKNWSPVYCFDDGSQAVGLLIQQGAVPISQVQLQNIRELQKPILSLF